jgi:outer membrane usher protein
MNQLYFRILNYFFVKYKNYFRVSFLLFIAVFLKLDGSEPSNFSFEAEVFVNDRSLGTTFIILNEENKTVLIQSGPVQKIISKLLSPEFMGNIEEWFEDRDSYFSPFSLDTSLSITFEECLQVVQIFINPRFLKEQTISCSKQTAGYDPETLKESANWSGYLNIRLGRGIGYRYIPEFQSIPESTQILSNFSIQHADWSLTGTINPHSHRFGHAVNNILWIKDCFERDLRIFVGEFCPPAIGIQPNTTLLGVGLTRNPFVVEQESPSILKQYDFFLPNSSRVELYANGALHSTYELGAGPYSFRNFPTLPGGNQIDFRIYEAEGRLQSYQIDYFYDPSLLEQGELDYSSSFGTLQNFHENRFLWNQLMFSGYIQYGMTSQWTSGVYLQTSPKQCQFGTENTWVSKHLKTTVDLGGSWLLGHLPQPKLRVYMQNAPTKKNLLYWNAIIEYLGKRYSHYHFKTYRNYLNFRNSVIFSASLNLARPFFDSCYGALNISYNLVKNNRSKFGLSGSISKRIASSVYGNLSVYSSSINPYCKSEQGIVFNINWTPSQSNFRGNAIYDSYRNSVITSLGYERSLGGASSINASMGIEHQAHENALIASVNYQGEYMEAQASNYASLLINRSGKKIRGRSGFLLGTGLVFADGVFGLSRPIYDSFIMIKPSASLQAAGGIGVNPIGEEQYMAKSWRFLPAIIPNVGAYVPTTVSLEAPELPLTSELSANFYTCLPKYKGGVLIRTEDKTLFFVEGTIYKSPEKPWACQLGCLKSVGDSSDVEVPFFTDRNGRFQIICHQTGRFSLYMNDTEPTGAILEIPENTPPGFLDIGTIFLEEEPVDTI